MRLSALEKEVIVMTIRAFDPSAEVYLYGSRVDDSLKGGDIDILVLSRLISFSQKIDILIQIKELLGEQKIDLLIRKPSEKTTDPFLQKLLPTAVELTESKQKRLIIADTEKN